MISTKYGRQLDVGIFIYFILGGVSLISTDCTMRFFYVRVMGLAWYAKYKFNIGSIHLDVMF